MRKQNEYIIKNLHHGTTFAAARGGYTNNDKTIIYTVCKRAEAFRLRIFIKKTDPKSFIIVTTTSEIIGRGFIGVSRRVRHYFLMRKLKKIPERYLFYFTAVLSCRRLRRIHLYKIQLPGRERLPGRARQR